MLANGEFRATVNMLDSFFIKIPKTAGTSVLRAFETVIKFSYVHPVGETPKHKGLVCYKSGSPYALVEAGKVSQEFMDRAFKFCFVRNPWDRVVSSYFFVMYRRRRGEKFVDCIPDPNMTFKAFCERICLHPLEPITWNKRTGLSICNPQTAWIIDKDGKVFPNFIGRFENLEHDFAFVCKKIGIPDLKLPEERHRKTEHGPYPEYYDEETKAMVATKYAKDIEMFGYKFNE